jgi:phosphatidate cytidylyltransferase
VQAGRAQFDEANARITARTGRNLVFATGLGLALGGALLLSLLLVKAVFVLLAVIMVAFGTFELASALRRSGVRVPRYGSALVGVLVQPIAYLAMSPAGESLARSTGAPDSRADLGYRFPAGWLLAVVVAVVVVVAWRLAEHLTAKVPGRVLVRDLGATVFVQLYVTLLGSAIVVLTAQPGGQWWTLSFIVVVVATDVFAYVSGLAFGKHPMAPRISPKKTWEGFAGSALAAVVVASVLAPLLLDEPVWFGPLLGLAIVLTGTLGDLAESMIKRDIGVKDMSSWLPGHGGFLDRIDSVLPSGATALLLFLLFA